MPIRCHVRLAYSNYCLLRIQQTHRTWVDRSAAGENYERLVMMTCSTFTAGHEGSMKTSPEKLQSRATGPIWIKCAGPPMSPCKQTLSASTVALIGGLIFGVVTGKSKTSVLTLDCLLEKWEMEMDKSSSICVRKELRMIRKAGLEAFSMSPEGPDDGGKSQKRDSYCTKKRKCNLSPVSFDLKDPLPATLVR
ncbi:hypothetical protein M747DRAFT_329607 [Aspergillus niger ATCC 13496]|uniref:Uncharacterized protein n=3 Tax=Aspergillus niger TaxID=5061 RepID=A2QGX5_ASPNC|nr:hypothetical protein An03g04830 [Aspergillus niger]RDH22821.1 hypothetical protein M747DRAFT_329607 [Aspergillus niger ATCC 13496]CAK38275.1 hypothetical protein An03g04830 [Aspergillus niger]